MGRKLALSLGPTRELRIVAGHFSFSRRPARIQPALASIEQAVRPDGDGFPVRFVNRDSVIQTGSTQVRRVSARRRYQGER